MWPMNAISKDDQLDRETAKKVIRRSWELARPFRRTIQAALLLVTIWTATTLAGPVIVKFGIDEGLVKKNSHALNLAVIAYIVTTVAAYFIARLQFVYINRAGEGFLRDLRVRVFDHLQRQGLSFFDREKTGVLVSRMTADIESMGELIQWGLLQFVSAGLLVVMSLVLLFTLSWELTLLAMVVFPIIVVASIRFQRDSNKAYLVVRERIGNNLSSLQEGISGVRVIQAFDREDEQSRRFRVTNDALFDSHMHSIKVSMWYFGLVEFCGILATASMVGVGGYLVHRGSVSVGVVTAFVLLLGSLFDPVSQLSQLYNTVQSSGAALQKLYGILDTPPEVSEVNDAVVLPAVGELVVRDVGFEYVPSRPVLSNVSITVAIGERLALVGPTGAGKSTLAKLMSRLYDPTVGTVSFAGIDLRSATLQSLRERVVVVPQEGFLFSGTIRENLSIARPSATDAEITASLQSIGVLDHFLAFPEGLDTEVRERGSRLSAGERQLVALARAALVDPAVLVLDEATSNLDPGTEAEVEHALESLMLNRTVIVVAHRLSTVRRADRIAVVDHGALAELGTHDELVALGGKYAALSAAWERNQVGSSSATNAADA
jgi:ATP-binding cassette subfamily B protein